MRVTQNQIIGENEGLGENEPVQSLPPAPLGYGMTDNLLPE